MSKFNKTNSNNERRNDFMANTERILRDDESRISKQRKRLAGTAIAGLLTAGGFATHNTMSSDETHNENKETEYSNSIVIEAPKEGEEVSIHIDTKARLRESPNIGDPRVGRSNLIHETSPSEQHKIPISFENDSDETSITLEVKDGHNNPDWIGIPTELLNEELKHEVSVNYSDDGPETVWVSSSKVSVETNEIDPTDK